jgi:hypothetical protein
LNKTSRTKRAAGLTGLLAVAALALSACGSSAADEARKHPLPPVPPKENFASLGDSKKVELEAGFSETFSAAQEKAISQAGLKVLQIIAQDHPEYTKYGFKPSLEQFDKEVAPALKPLVAPHAWANLRTSWGKGQSFAITAYNPDSKDWTVENKAGEKCTASKDSAFELSLAGWSLRRIELNGTIVPVFDGNVNAFVHCQEGGLAMRQVVFNYNMEQVGGQWKMGSEAHLEDAGNDWRVDHANDPVKG